jgi:hypothetical protein
LPSLLLRAVMGVFSFFLFGSPECSCKHCL